MRKILILLLCAIMILSFSGCADKREVEYAKAPETTVPEKGRVEGERYGSSFSELAFNKPENWIYATDDELATVEKPEGVYYDMICQNPETGSHAAVMIEELLLTAGNITITEDKYIENISEGYYNSGLEVIEQKDIELGGNTYKSVTVYGEAEEISVMQCTMVRKIGNSMVSVMAVAFNEDELDDILKCFE